MLEVCTLTSLKDNESATIVDISGSDEVKARFEDLGIIPGTVVSYLTQIAFGGPLTLKCRGSKIAIRSQAASHVLVQKIAA